MNMGDVFAIFGTLLAIGIALPGMLLAWALLLPSLVERASGRLGSTPWRCFWLGFIWLLLSVPPIVLLLKLPSGPAQLFGWGSIVLLVTLASIGAAGLAALMGERLRGTGAVASSFGPLVRGALALELAAAFPIIGWFVVVPMTAICALGATGLALLRRNPRSRPVPPIEAAPAAGSALPNA